MRKHFFSFLLLFLLFLGIPNSLFAQQQSQRWICLNAVWCDQAGKCSRTDVHRAKLSVKPDIKPLANSDTFVVECLATPAGQICTTGDSVTDQRIYGVNNVSRLASVVQYRFQGFFQADGTAAAPNPSKSSNVGLVGPFEWKSSTPNGVARKFLALNYFSAGSDTGTIGGQQQGTFSFENAARSCVSINWDPYGRVFDSQTLEPIPEAVVTLLQKRVTGEFTPVRPDDLTGGNIVNPQITVENGEFSFVVPDNTYKLSVNRGEYSFPNIAAKLNPAYSRIYSDIYRNEEIVQRGTIQHRDIPLDHIASGKTYPLTVDFFYEAGRSGKGIVEGRTSHPFAIVKAYSVLLTSSDPAQREPTRTRYKLLQTINSDKNGKFRLEVSQTGFETNEVFGEIEVQKANLLQNTTSKSNFFQTIISYMTNFLGKIQVEAMETTTIKLDPIPTYLEGYAYGLNGQLLTEATVGVYLTFSEKPYHETKSDKNGYFKIRSENLPNMPYKIKYTSLSGQTDISTSKFTVQNEKYLAKNKISLNTYVSPSISPEDKTDISPKELKNNNGSSNSVVDSNVNNGVNNNNRGILTNPLTANSQSSVLLLIVVMLVFLGVAGMLLGFYLYKKNQVSP